jgi:hypothetical protein
MLLGAKLFLILSGLTFILGLITRFLGYGIGRGAPWAFGITPDAYLRLTNTLLLFSIALKLFTMISV